MVKAFAYLRAHSRETECVFESRSSYVFVAHSSVSASAFWIYMYIISSTNSCATLLSRKDLCHRRTYSRLQQTFGEMEKTEIVFNESATETSDLVKHQVTLSPSWKNQKMIPHIHVVCLHIRGQANLISAK